MQIRFDPLEYQDQNPALSRDEAQKLALRERNVKLKELKAQGKRASGFTLRNQLRQYAGLGISDGRIRNVYYIQSEEGY